MGNRYYGRRGRRRPTIARDMAIAGGIFGALKGTDNYFRSEAEEQRLRSLEELRRKYRQEDRETAKREAEARMKEARAYNEGRSNEARIYAESKEAQTLARIQAEKEANRATLMTDRSIAKADAEARLQESREYTEGRETERREYEEGKATANRENLLSDKAETREYSEKAEKARELGKRVNATLKDIEEAGSNERVKIYAAMGIEPSDKDKTQKIEDYHKAEIERQFSAFDENRNAIHLLDDSEPGSSRDNPVDATSYENQPPSGTWVRLPDGSVRQVP